jgi:subtilisin family serine protease
MSPALAACGAGGSEAPLIPAPPVAPPPPPPPPTPPQIDYDTAEYQRSNAATAIKALSAYSKGATGEGVTIALVDSGVNPALPEFAGKISSSSQDVAGTRGMGDDDGHGTAVAAILVAARNDAELLYSAPFGVGVASASLFARKDPGHYAQAPDDVGFALRLGAAF